MERIQKEQASRCAASASHIAQGKSAGFPAQTDMATRIHSSPLMVAQGKLLQGMFGDRVQLQTEEEEPLQGKFAVAQCEGLEDEEPLQGKFTAQCEEMPEEEEPLQGKFATAQLEGIEEEEPLQGRFAPESTVQRETEPAKPNNTGLPDDLKTGVESLSGMSLDHVNVHYNSSQPAQLNSLAYAQGSDIHVAPGQEKHLPHEAWHIVQQAQGRVQPTRQMKDGVPVNDEAGLEHEADVMGGRALQAKESQAGSSENVKGVGRTSLATPAVQHNGPRSFQLTTSSLLQPPDPLARYRLAPELQMQFSPEIEMLLRSRLEQELNPSILISALGRLDLSLPSPSLATPGGADGTSPLASATPTPTPEPIVPRGAGPDKPRSGSVGDVLSAVSKVPAVSQLMENLQALILERLRRDWGRLNKNEKIGVATFGAAMTAEALIGVLSSSDGQRQTVDLLNGTIIPVPGIDFLSVELRLSTNPLFMVHVDVGGLLPKNCGFSSSSPKAIGGTP